MSSLSSKPITCQNPEVVVIENRSITSCDDRLDDKDTMRFANGRMIPAQGRSYFINNLQQNLGVQSFQNISLRKMVSFFTSFSYAERELGRDEYRNAFDSFTTALGNLKRANLYNLTTHKMIVESIAKTIEPGVKAAEQIKKSPNPKLNEVWHVLFGGPFAEFRSGSLHALVKDNIITAAKLKKIEQLNKDLLLIGLRVGPADAEAVLTNKKSSNQDRLAAYYALKGIRDAAIKAGIKFNRIKFDQLIRQLYKSIPANSPERAMMDPPIVMITAGEQP